MASKVAVVTGSNKGIGFGIVKELLKRNYGIVYLTSRDIARGKKAVEELKKEELNPEFHQLDITHRDSIKELVKDLKEKHGGIDLLINNAAIISNDFFKATYEDSIKVIDVNYRCLLQIQEELYPILNENARVVNISSDCGHISNLRNKQWIEKLTKKDLTVEDIDGFVDWFLNSLKTDTFKNEDWADNPIVAYKVSKIAFNALSNIQQRDIDRNISINCVHPGYVQTDMTRNLGHLTVDEAVKTPVDVALDTPQSLKGAYIWFDGRVLDWYDADAKYYSKFE